MLHYILQTVAFQLFFLIVYDLFLKKETFFNWNRAYLLITAILSVILPFVKFESVKHIVPKQFIIRLPEVIIGNVEPVLSPQILTSTPIITEPTLVWSWSYLWFFGMAIMCLFLGFKVLKLLRLYSKNPKRWNGNLLIIQLINSNAAFSFFYYIFLGDNIKPEEKTAILEHEMVHVNQKHTLDLLLFEIFKIAFWFNPLVYMYQSRITALHEFIADAKAVKRNNKQQYYQNLLSQVFDTQHISFVNPFFKQSLIKKRIMMLSKSKSKQIHLVKYALLIPLVFSMLMYTSSYAQKIKKTEETVSQNDTKNQELTLQELTEKYYQELIGLKKNEKNRAEIFKKYLPDNDKYINTKQEVARLQAYFKYLSEKIIDKKRKDGTLTDEDTEIFQGMTEKYATYDDYLSFKKTDEAKELWENSTHDGVVRLVVDDLKNLTADENKRRDKKLALIINDDYYHTFVMTDGKSSTKMVSSKPSTITEEPKVVEDYDVEVPYAVIDQAPTFSECESLATNDEKKQCTSNKIAEFVNKNFNIKIADSLGLTGKQRISVIFKIDKNGAVKNARARAAHPELEKEAIRVINLLPKMIPGKQKGKVVVVPYSLPILFQIKGDDTEVNQKKNDLTEVPFSVVDEVPLFPSCERIGSRDDQKACTSDKISSFFNKNFNSKLADELHLTGRQRIMVVFKIGTDGNISSVKSRASNPALEAEAIRVIKLLPKMLPGKQKGKPVVVSYSLPIMFQIHE